MGTKRIDVTFEEACWAEGSHDGWKSRVGMQLREHLGGGRYEGFDCVQTGGYNNTERGRKVASLKKSLSKPGAWPRIGHLYHTPSLRLMGQKDDEYQKSWRPEQNSVFQT